MTARRRIAIVGARPPQDGTEDEAVWLRIVGAVRKFVDSLPSDIVIISGGADGVDRVAVDWRRPGQEYREHRPDYARHGRRAPLERNSLIVADADEVHAFPAPWSRGTWDTVRKAEAAGKPCFVHAPREMLDAGGGR